jgi:hypothetical protein
LGKFLEALQAMLHLASCLLDLVSHHLVSKKMNDSSIPVNRLALTGRCISVAWRLSALGALPVAIFLCFAVWMWNALSNMDQILHNEVKNTTEMSLLAKDMQRNVIQVQ